MSYPAKYRRQRTSAPFHRLIVGIGGASAVLGCVVVAGWYLHLPRLVQVSPALAPMQYNTALCFVLVGVALIVWACGRGLPALPILAGIVAATSSLSLMEDLFRVSLGVDQLFFRPYIVVETAHAGRMSPISALSFTLTGLSLLSLSLRKAPRGRSAAIGAAASIVISICLIALVGYVFGLPGTYGWGQLTRMAIHTAAGLGAVGLALLLIAWNMDLHPGESAPRWLPVPLAFGVFTASLVLSFAVDGKQNQEIAQTVKAGADSAKNQVEVRMDSRTRSLVRMAKRWEFSGRPPRAAWEFDASNYVRDFPDLQALEWMDSDRVVRWIVPLAGNEAKLNRDLTQEPDRKAAVDEAVREHLPVITRVVTLFRGGLGFILYIPIVAQGHPDGFIAAVFDATSCLNRYLPPGVASGEAITVSEGDRLFYMRDSYTPSPRDGWVVAEEIELHGTTWEMRVWPTPELAARLDSPLPQIILFAGTLGSLLLAAVCYYAQRSSRQAIETARANAAMQAALDKVQTLEGLLPICSCCKRVRDDTGYWSQIDTYLHEHTNASLSHGYCPECAAKAFQDCGFEVPESVQAELEAGNFE